MALKFVFIKEVLHLALMTEEQPVPALRADGLPLLQKRAEGRDTEQIPGDDRFFGVGREGEIMRVLHIDFEFRAEGGVFVEEGRRHAETAALAHDVANAIDRERSNT